MDYQRTSGTGRVWQDSAKKKDVLEEGIERILKRHGGEFHVWKDRGWVDFTLAFPGLADPQRGQLLCVDCEQLYYPGDCEKQQILQKWGATYRLLCPKGHVVKSEDSMASWATYRPRTSLGDQAAARDAF